jgi:hypothetical protein
MTNHPASLSGVENVGTSTIRRGDRVRLDGVLLTVADMIKTSTGKNLFFEEGGTYHMHDGETFYAFRQQIKYTP